MWYALLIFWLFILAPENYAEKACLPQDHRLYFNPQFSPVRRVVGGRFQRHGTASVTCLNAPLQISKQSLSETVAKMLPAAQPHQSFKNSNFNKNKKGPNWPQIFKVASATVALLLLDGMSTVLGFYNEFAKPLLETLALALAIGVAVSVAIVIGSRIKEMFERYSKTKGTQKRAARANQVSSGREIAPAPVIAPAKRNDMKLPQEFGYDYSLVIKHIRELAAQAPEKNMLFSAEYQEHSIETILKWAGSIRNSLTNPLEVVRLVDGLIIAQGGTPDRLEQILQIAISVETLYSYHATTKYENFIDAVDEYMKYLSIIPQLSLVQAIINDEVRVVSAQSLSRRVSQEATYTPIHFSKVKATYERWARIKIEKFEDLVNTVDLVLRAI